MTIFQMFAMQQFKLPQLQNQETLYKNNLVLEGKFICTGHFVCNFFFFFNYHLAAKSSVTIYKKECSDDCLTDTENK